jgi:hypothetical protein
MIVKDVGYKPSYSPRRDAKIMGQAAIVAAAALTCRCNSQTSGTAHIAPISQILSQRSLNQGGHRRPDILCRDISLDRFLQIIRNGYGYTFHRVVILASVGAAGESAALDTPRT